MTLGEEIRAHVLKRHLSPASAKGARQITLRAGDIHHEMKLSARMPSVCNAMGSRALLESAHAAVVSRKGPRNGANVFFTYAFGDGKRPVAQKASRREPSTKPAATERPSPTGDFRNALVLVSCTKSKLGRAAPAADLYTSTFFRLSRSLIERAGADWRILSAKYGLVAPTDVIAPYELTLKTMGVAHRRRWAEGIGSDLLPICRQYDKVVILAGLDYREFLVPQLASAGIEVAIPMEGLRQGEQLAWLSQA